MASIKSFVNKIKQKSKEYNASQKEKKAQAKGFSSAKAYEFYSNTAKTQGMEKAKSKLRKKELKRIEKEAEQEVMMGRTGKYHKVQRKVQRGFETFEKGARVYNEVMGGLKALNTGNDSFYPYEKPRRRSKPKTAKRKQKPKQKPRSFEEMFY